MRSTLASVSTLLRQPRAFRARKTVRRKVAPRFDTLEDRIVPALVGSEMGSLNLTGVPPGSFTGVVSSLPQAVGSASGTSETPMALGAASGTLISPTSLPGTGTGTGTQTGTGTGTGTATGETHPGVCVPLEQVQPAQANEIIHVCHRTHSDSNPFVLLGVRQENPSIQTHLLNGDIVVRTSESGGVVTNATIQYLGTDVVGGPTHVISISGQPALDLLAGLNFQQGETGNDQCDVLASRLGLNLNVNPGQDRPQRTGNTPADFVQNVYFSTLRRYASPDEVNSWLGVLQSSGQGAVVSGISASEEAQLRVVDDWYTEFLGRGATGGEEMGWVNQLTAGASQDTVLTAILTSPEFYARAGGTDSAYVQALYHVLLQRSPSASEQDSWVATLGTQGRQSVVAGIRGSSEFRGSTLDSLYANLLGRAADDAGRATWVNSGKSLADIRKDLLASPEFLDNDNDAAAAALDQDCSNSVSIAQVAGIGSTALGAAGSTEQAGGETVTQVVGTSTQEVLHVCHRTHSDTNPFVDLGIKDDVPSVQTHLLNGDIVIRMTLTNGVRTDASIQYLPDGVAAMLANVKTVTGAAALADLNGLNFDQPGDTGADACVTLAQRLGLNLNVNPGQGHDNGGGNGNGNGHGNGNGNGNGHP